jgi:hypothetical protein
MLGTDAAAPGPAENAPASVDVPHSAESGSVQRRTSPALASLGIFASSPDNAKCRGPRSIGISDDRGSFTGFAGSTWDVFDLDFESGSVHPAQPFEASNTTSAFRCPASARLTWYGLPTYVIDVFATVCGL